MTEAKLTQNLDASELETLLDSKLRIDETTTDDGGSGATDQKLSADIAAKVAQEILKELSNKNSAFLTELKTIVHSIDSAKDEIASIRPKELTEKDLPDAANSLDIIIQTSEEACSNILGCAEELMEVAEYVPSKLNARLMEISTKLFESSNFDDLNGQRVRKVIKTLKNIEDRLKGLLDAYGEDYEKVAPDTSDPKKSKDEALMNGPQDAGAAASQEEIDAILNGF